MDNIQLQNEEKRGLSACAIKYIAVVAMVIDHIGWCFVDTYTPLGIIMHTIGRITAPIMTYFIAEGFHYTKNVNRYLLRLGIFAALSCVPFLYMDFGILFPLWHNGEEWVFYPYQGVIYTFFLTVLALKTVHSEKLNGAAKSLIVFMLCVAALIGDWLFIPIIWAMLFDKYRGSFKGQAAAFAISSALLMGLMILPDIIYGNGFGNLFQFGVLLALIPLYFYNGKRGRLLGKGDKWFFYVFYPLHMLILGFLAHGIAAF